MIPFDAGAIGGKCRTNAEFYSIYYKQSDFGCQVFCAKVPGGAKGFKFVYANLLFWCAASRFAKPRNFPKKVLIVAVRRCHCGGLIRGLQNLDAPCKRETVFVLFACTKRTGSTPEVCEPLDSGDDSNRRSIRCFCESDRRSSGNRLC